MIAVDTDVLVYAHRREVNEHAQARQLVTTLAEGDQGSWAIPWPCIYEFFSVVTNVRIWKSLASTPAQAWGQVEAWMGSPTLSLLSEPPDFAPVLAQLALLPRVRGPLIHDARVAAICLAHGVEALLSRDRDFTLFPALPVRNPFASAK